MYSAKAAGGNGFAAYRPYMHAAIAERVQTTAGPGAASGVGRAETVRRAQRRKLR